MKRLPVALISLSMLLLASTHGWGQLTGKSLILQDSSSPARKITLRTPGALSNSYTLVYPSALPGGNGYLLTGTTGGLLSWSDPNAVVGSLAWLLRGNGAITVPTADTIGAAQNFLGTTTAQELVLGTNRVRRVRVDGTSGNVGIGAAPSAADRLNVHGMINTDSSYNIGGANWLWAGPGLGGANNVLVGNTTNATLAADDNTFVGALAGRDASTGIDNTIIGSNAGRTVTTGADNTYIGAFTGQQNTEGSGNTIVGSSSGNVMSSGDYNTFAGFASGNSLFTGSYNTIIGGGAVNTLNQANEITVLGALATTNMPNNATAIGARAFANANNSMVLGSINGVNGATADVNVGIGATAPSQKLEVKNGNLLLSNSGTAAQLRLQEPLASGADSAYTAFVAQAQSGNIIYTLPGSLPAANNYLLSSTTAGLLSWASPASVVGSAAWLLTGNNITAGGTGAGQQFIGTTSGNKQPFVVATDGAERMRVDSNGMVGIGTTTPAHRLTVETSFAPSGNTDFIGGRVHTALSPTGAYAAQTNAFEGQVTVNNSAVNDPLSIVNGIDGGALHAATATANAGRLMGVRGWVSSANATRQVQEGIGVLGYITNPGGNYLNATSLKAYGDGFAGSAMTNWRGLHVGGYQGPVANIYGIDIDPITNGTVSNTAFRYSHATRPVTITGDAKVLIGTGVSEAERLTIKDTISPSVLADKFATHSRLYFSPTVPWIGTQSANGLRADVVLQNAVDVNSERVAGIIGAGVLDTAATHSVSQLRGVKGNILQRNTTQSIDHAIAIEGAIGNDGIINHATSVFASQRNATTATIGTYRGLYVASPNAGAIDSVVAIDVEPQLLATNNLAFRYHHATSPVAITGAGSMGVGTSAPAQKLELRDGNMFLSNSGTAGELRMQEPNGSGANYTAFKAQAQSANITYTLPPSLPVANDYVLTSSTGGSLAWGNPSTILGSGFVQYNVPTPQATAVAANRLFDVRYAALAAGTDALGARILSASGTNASATGLSITSTANGTGAATGLNVSASGGANNYAALFTSGNVGIGISNPNSKLYVNESIATANRDTQMVALWYNFSPAANPTPSVSVAGQIIRMQVSPTAAQTSTLISGADMGVGLVSTATAGAGQLNGVRAFASSASTTQTLTNGVGLMAHVQNSGLMTNGISLLANMQSLTGGVMTNYYGLKVASPGITAGTIDNVYGISIDQLSGGTVSNTAFRYNHSTVPTVIMASGKVGHGTASPESYVEIAAPTYTSTTTVPGTWTTALAQKISQTVNPSGTTAANYHSLMSYDSLAVTGSSNMASGVAIARLVRTRNFNTSSIGELRSFQANVHNEAGGAVTLADALYANVSNNSNGTIASAITYHALSENTGSGVVTTATGLRTRPNVSGTGNITTFNGVLVDVASHTGTGVVQNYNGLVVNNIDAAEVPGTRNVFLYNAVGPNKAMAITGAGNIGIGTTTPTASLDVDGGVVLREDASVANVNADNFPVTVGNRSYMRITCNQAGAAANKTLTLSAGVRTGQILVIEALGNNQFEIADNSATNRTNTPASRTMSAGAVETMIWNGTEWLEMSFVQN